MKNYEENEILRVKYHSHRYLYLNFLKVYTTKSFPLPLFITAYQMDRQLLYAEREIKQKGSTI